MSFRFGFQVDEPAGSTTKVTDDQRRDDESAPRTPLEVVAMDLESHRMASPACTRLDTVPFQLFRATINVDSVTGTHRDVVRGAYEGGGKTWECTYDLLQLLAQSASSSGGAMHARHVLDLGAGTGLLGCAALALGAQHVTFQDLNAGVLQHITAANIALNAPAQLPVPLPVTLLAGDWASVLQGVREGARECTAVGKHTVQLVLSSETLYDPRLYTVLLDLIAEVLALPTAAQAGAGAGTGDGEAGTAAARGEGGRALFATKRYYYGEGLGGGSATFLEAARAHPAGFHAERVASVEDGRTMIRDILQLTWAA